MTETATAANAARHGIFISYSREEMAEHDELVQVLDPAIRLNDLSLWSDRRIPPGADWPTELATALDSCRVAILLVTSRYLASNFIRTAELEPILAAHAERHVTVIWVAVESCRYELTGLASIHAANEPSRPIRSLGAHARARAWLDIAKKVEAAALGKPWADAVVADANPSRESAGRSAAPPADSPRQSETANSVSATNHSISVFAKENSHVVINQSRTRGRP